MNQKKYSPIMQVVLALLLVLCLTGCGEEGNNDVEYDTVFTFDGTGISLGETYIYAKTVQEDYVSTYGEDVWSMEVTLEDGSTKNMAEVTREDIIWDIVRVKMLLKQAEDRNITLTEEEKEKAIAQSEDFWKNLTDEQIQEMQLSEEMVQNILIENALAQKTYLEILSRAEIEVSDEDARETTFYDMYFECYSEDGNGNIVPYTEEEKRIQYEKALQAYSTLIDPIDTEANVNIESLSEYYDLDHSSYYTMTPEEIENVYGTDIYENLYKLDDGSFSLVTETEYGYHIFYMTALTDREATDKNKATMTAALEKAYFDDQFQSWLKKTDKKFSYEESVNMEVYEKIPF